MDWHLNFDFSTSYNSQAFNRTCIMYIQFNRTCIYILYSKAKAFNFKTLRKLKADYQLLQLLFSVNQKRPQETVVLIELQRLSQPYKINANGLGY